MLVRISAHSRNRELADIWFHKVVGYFKTVFGYDPNNWRLVTVPIGKTYEDQYILNKILYYACFFDYTGTDEECLKIATDIIRNEKLKNKVRVRIAIDEYTEPLLISPVDDGEWKPFAER